MRPPTIEMSTPSQPLINRTTKPAIEIKKIEEIPMDQPVTYPVPLPRSTIPKMPSIEKESDKIITEPSPVNRVGPVPKVDRNLKINAMVKYLQDEETLVEKHLAMTVNQLEKEKEWDKIRSEREASANNEITNQLQEREKQMLEMFNKMENDNKQQVLFIYSLSKKFIRSFVYFSQELEIARLRKQVETIRTAMENKTKPDAEENQIQARINEKEVKQAAMNREVERLRELRKDKEKAREKEKEEREKDEELKRNMQRLKDDQARKNEDLKKKREEENKREEEKRR